MGFGRDWKDKLRTPLYDIVHGPVPSWGQGISRPVKGEKTRLYKLVVRAKGVGLMKVKLRAPSAEEAIKYAKNRWPESEVSRR